MIFRSSTILAVFTNIVVAVFLVPVGALAQSITLTGPATDRTVIEGDDYFSTVVDNPRDFNEVNDAGWFENFDGRSVSIANGIWSSNLNVVGAWFMPLYGGHKDNLYPDNLPGDRNFPGYGFNRPIDASKYTTLAYRLKPSARSNFALYWENDKNANTYLGRLEGSYCSSNDGLFNGSQFRPHSGFVVYNYNMTNLPVHCGQRGGSWSGGIFALRIDPSTGAPVGSNLQVDWVRIVDPTSAPLHTINWNATGVAFDTQIRVYADNNNSGFDGDFVASFNAGSNPGSIDIQTATFPPGTYHFYLEIQRVGVTDGAISRSGYTPALIINAKPRLYVTSPSYDTGKEYAQEALANPWDMDLASANFNGDVANLGNCAANGRAPIFCDPVFQQFTGAQFFSSSDAQRAGSLFYAQGNVPLAGNAESDVQVHLKVPNNNPINPAQYRYLVYRMQIDKTAYPDPVTQLRDGWVARVVPWNTDIIGDGGRFKAHRVWEGMLSYATDLYDSNTTEDIPGFAAPTPWRNFTQVKNFRLDPGEFVNVATAFALDYVALYSENNTTNGQFTVTYELSDSDSSSFNTQIFRDNNNSGFDGTLIGSATGLGAGSHSFTWNGSGVSDGEAVYFYIVATDSAGNTSRAYSKVHVNKGEFVAPPVPRGAARRMDFDGDGKDDLSIKGARFGITQLFTKQSTAGATARALGHASSKLIVGDFEGDGKADLGLVTDVFGVLYWYIIRSSDGGIYSPAWGVTGDKVAIGDYEGDGKDDVAIFRPSEGAWYVLLSSGGSYFQPWGLPGDKPVAEDYDGDGKTDYAVWRPSEGNWYILESSTGNTSAKVHQWGLSGDIPVPGDWTNDGKADVAVWRPSVGTWYIKNPANNNTEVAQWGLPGDVPIVGDFDGDGTLELTVFRPAFGTWFHNFRNGLSTGVQFGLPGDTLPVRVDFYS